MESYLVCQNPKCHMVLDLREFRHVSDRSGIITNECPECGSQWSPTCPFCGKPLDVALRGGLPHCSSCRQKLQARAA
jgi:predicted amidophosphoribosyltransferase